MIEAQKDITLNEMVAGLKDEQSVGIGRSMLSRWLRQHRWTFKEDRTCIGAGARKYPETSAGLVRQPALTSIRTVGSSSTKPASPRRWPVCVVVLYAENAVGQAFLTAHHFHRRPAPHGHDRTLRP
ncbi:hypothetical protein DY926_14850 [Komagataeibacter melaceti]|uniref:Uncharacterized protein n=1 Tax=Komagataeibacter melaceti TaxID=2766577 RepID=A0A371YWZ8_9PROT|nr:hypothetical protein DY926_14850 [Komagataeibacter melaceti]